MRDSSKSTLSALKGTMHKSVVGYYRTKDFIKALRRCKTPVEEKALVAKEAAGIRQALRSPLTTADHRYHSLGKLLVLHLLGHTTLYGQVEYIKLAGNVRKATGRPRLNHKRLGYLGCALLLDREQPTLPLICNTINHDLAISLEQNDATIGALASTALGLLTGISSIARELLPDILVMLSEPRLSADVRRRLIACTARAVQANGVESGELFVSTTRGVQPVMHACLEALLADRSEGTLMAYCQLLANLLTFAGVEERTILGEQGRARLLPTLMRVYNGVGSWSPENDLSRMPNPVLQSALLRCFALLGHKDTVSSDFIANSLLHQSSAHNPTTEGRRPSGANNTSSQSSSQPWTLVAVNLLMDRCACILEIEAPAAARAVAIRQLEELLLAEDISDSTVRYCILSRLGEQFAGLLPHGIVMHAVSALGTDLDWPFRRKLLAMAMRNGLAPREYREDANRILDLLEISSKEEQQVGEEVTALLVELSRQLAAVGCRDGPWLTRQFVPRCVPKLAGPQAWTCVSLLLDLLDACVSNPRPLDCLSTMTLPPTSTTSTPTSTSLYAQAVNLWCHGEDIFAREPPALSLAMVASNDRLASYYLTAVGKWTLCNRHRIDDVMDTLQSLVRPPAQTTGKGERLSPWMVERVVEMASLLSRLPQKHPSGESGRKKIDDYTMEYVALVRVQRLQRVEGHYEIMLINNNDTDTKKTAVIQGEREIIVDWPVEHLKEIVKGRHYVVQQVDADHGHHRDDGDRGGDGKRNECRVGLFHRLNGKWHRQLIVIDEWPKADDTPPADKKDVKSAETAPQERASPRDD